MKKIFDFPGFLSCLCGSELEGRCKSRHCDFLSCLCGSEQKPKAALRQPELSELPMRQ